MLNHTVCRSVYVSRADTHYNSPDACLEERVVSITVSSLLDQIVAVESWLNFLVVSAKSGGGTNPYSAIIFHFFQTIGGLKT